MTLQQQARQVVNELGIPITRFCQKIGISTTTYDKPDNLLWVTKAEHTALHRLLRAGQTSEYNKLAKAIQTENNIIFKE